MKARFDCVFYYVSDLERSVRFYVDALGLRLHSQDVVARFDAGGVLLELVPASDMPTLGAGGNARACLSVDDLAASVAELRARGVAAEPIEVVENGMMSRLRDPDGNELVLWQYADTAVTLSDRLFLRHALATLAYRGGKVIGGVPESFGAFRVGATSRSASEILAHVDDLLDWGLSLARGAQTWHDSAPAAWDQDAARFFEGLRLLDVYLASDAPLGYPAERLFQGPIADALTHIGQLAMMRRLAGLPVRGENYFRAEIAAGRVGPQQAAPRYEFD